MLGLVALPHQNAVDAPREVQVARSCTQQDDTNTVAVWLAALGKKTTRRCINLVCLTNASKYRLVSLLENYRYRL